MTPFKSGTLVVGGYFDRIDDDLLIEIEQEFTYCEVLSRAEVVRLRDHLNKILGVAP